MGDDVGDDFREMVDQLEAGEMPTTCPDLGGMDDGGFGGMGGESAGDDELDRRIARVGAAGTMHAGRPALRAWLVAEADAEVARPS